MATPTAATPLLTAAEQQLLLHEWNATAVSWNGVLGVHELFREKVREQPGAIALSFAHSQLDYRTLDERSDCVARYLLDIGVTSSDVVAVCVPRSLDVVVALLGVMKAGAAYEP